MMGIPHLAVIRTYLHERFEGFEMTERSEGYMGHWFALGELEQRYKLAVASARLSDRDYTAAKMTQADPVAEAIRVRASSCFHTFIKSSTQVSGGKWEDSGQT